MHQAGEVAAVQRLKILRFRLATGDCVLYDALRSPLVCFHLCLRTHDGTRPESLAHCPFHFLVHAYYSTMSETKIINNTAKSHHTVNMYAQLLHKNCLLYTSRCV